MGISILELVLRRLREESFRADAAYPGQVYPVITEPIAAAHIREVDRASLTVTVEVDILSPLELGGTACELEALRATEILHWSGAKCIQSGCVYDGNIRGYRVTIQAVFDCVTEKADCVLGPGFLVYINELSVRHAVAFTGEKTTEYEAQYEIGETAPVGVREGRRLWKITLEELIPVGVAAEAQALELLELRLEKCDGKKETYYHCHWVSETRGYTREGLRRVRTGFAMDMEEDIL